MCSGNWLHGMKTPFSDHHPQNNTVELVLSDEDLGTMKLYLSIPAATAWFSDTCERGANMGTREKLIASQRPQWKLRTHLTSNLRDFLFRGSQCQVSCRAGIILCRTRESGVRAKDLATTFFLVLSPLRGILKIHIVWCVLKVPWWRFGWSKTHIISSVVCSAK